MILIIGSVFQTWNYCLLSSGAARFDMQSKNFRKLYYAFATYTHTYPHIHTYWQLFWRVGKKTCLGKVCLPANKTWNGVEVKTHKNQVSVYNTQYPYIPYSWLWLHFRLIRLEILINFFRHLSTTFLNCRIVDFFLFTLQQEFTQIVGIFVIKILPENSVTFNTFKIWKQ